jgi:hypothetical protein
MRGRFFAAPTAGHSDWQLPGDAISTTKSVARKGREGSNPSSRPHYLHKRNAARVINASCHKRFCDGNRR